MGTVNNVVVERHGNGKRHKIKPPAWSHQAELKAAFGKKIYLYHGMAEESAFTTGRLLNADPYTFQIQIGQSVMTVQKHAVARYELEK
jgi:hypothetical protein